MNSRRTASKIKRDEEIRKDQTLRSETNRLIASSDRANELAERNIEIVILQVSAACDAAAAAREQARWAKWAAILAAIAAIIAINEKISAAVNIVVNSFIK